MGITITPISKEEFLSHRKGRPPMAETKAVVDLEQGTGIKFPCRWNHHHDRGLCYGASTIRAATRRHGQTVKFTCKGGTLYAWRTG